MNARALLASPPSKSGSYRDVYDLGDAVLKVDRDPDRSTNLLEYRLWRAIRRRKEARHFARIIRRYPNGNLLMERADELLADSIALHLFDPDIHLEPEVLAAFDRHHLRDIHPYNVGIFGGKQKIIDYGEL